MVDSVDVSKKMPGSKFYGSTHTLATISTETYTPSAASTSSSSDNCTSASDNVLQMHHMRLDMSSIENRNIAAGSGGSTEASNLLSSSKQRTRSTDSSSLSDVSSYGGGGGGYYSRYAMYRHYSRTSPARYFIQHCVFTLQNFKVVISFAAWFVSYMIMGVFGGSVAYLHFERSDRDIPEPLPDFGYEIIPVSILHAYIGMVECIILYLDCARVVP